MNEEIVIVCPVCKKENTKVTQVDLNASVALNCDKCKTHFVLENLSKRTLMETLFKNN